MKRNNAKKTIFIISSIMLSALLVGCGKRDVDYVSENGTSAESVTVVTETIREQYLIPETWEEGNVDKNNTVSIDADIIVPNISSMNVYEMKRRDWTPDNKREFVEAFSEGTVYKYDFEYYTKDMLKCYIEEQEQRIKVYEENGVYIDNPYIEEMDYEQLEMYNTLYEDAKEELIPIDDYENNTFLIEYNGMEYEINTQTLGIEMRLLDSYIEAYGAEKEYPYGISVDTESQVLNSSENKATITNESAEKTALDFLEKQGIYDFSVIETNMACLSGFNEMETDVWYNGYTVILGRNVDGILIDSYKLGADSGNSGSYNSIYIKQFEENVDYNWGAGEWPVPTSNFERIYVVVNDYGVIYYRYDRPLDKVTVMAENVPLLSFERIQDAITTELYDKSYYSYARITQLELLYFPYEDIENPDNLAIIPVWACRDSSNNLIVLVNAIDGSIINLGLQFYDLYHHDEFVSFQ